MKKYLIFMFLLFNAFIIHVNASPTSSMSVSSKTITTGQSVEALLTIRNFTSAQVSMQGTGNTSGCSYNDILQTDTGENITRTVKITCKANSVGIINISYKVSALDKNYESKEFSGNQRVTVVAPREKDTNNYLKSLTLENFSLSPSFEKDVLEYKAIVPSTTDKVKILADSVSNYAKVYGIGEFEVEEGSNNFEIEVISESGLEKIYKLNVIVEDQNPIEVLIDEQKYTVIKNIKNVTKPDLYESSTIKIKDIEVPAFVSDITEYTLVALKDSNGKVVFAIYDEKNNSYQLYEEQKSNSLILYLLPFEKEFEGYIKSSITIHERVYEAFKVNEDSEYAIVYAMNIETGEKDYYVYHAKNNTYQQYYDEEVVQLKKEKSTYQQVILGLAGCCILLAILSMVGFLRKPNKKLLKRIQLMEEHHKLNEKENIPDVIESLTEEMVEEEKISETKEKKKKVKKSKKEKKNSKKKDNLEIEEQVSGTSKNETSAEVPEILEVDEAIHKMNDAEEIIREFEKTMALSSSELKKAKKKDSVDEFKEDPTKKLEETMFDLFEEDRKKKRK